MNIYVVDKYFSGALRMDDNLKAALGAASTSAPPRKINKTSNFLKTTDESIIRRKKTHTWHTQKET